MMRTFSHYTLGLLAVLLATLGCRDEAGPEVVIYTSIDQNVAEPILAGFEAESGIRARAVYDVEAAKTSGLVTRLLAEAPHPRCDVFWNNEPVQTFLLADREVLEPCPLQAAADLPPEFKDPQGRWTAVAARARVVVYNTKYVPPSDAPRSLVELTDAKWRGKIAIADPQFGTTRTHAAALFAVLGPERAQQFFQGLLANQVRIVDGNARVENLVARADPQASPIYLGLTDTDDVLSGQADGEPVAMVYPDQDSFGTLVVPSLVSRVRGGPNPEPARQLLEYLAGPEVERQLVSGRSGFLSLRSGTPPGKALPKGTVPFSSNENRDRPPLDPARILKPPRGMELTNEAILEQLEPSSRWTKEHFHP
jgi:iron(III) transport system substrate-binding protein